MKISSNPLVSAALVVCATASPVLAAPLQSSDAVEGVGTALSARTPSGAPQQKAQKSMLPLAPPNPISLSALPAAIQLPGYYRLTKDLTGVSNSSGLIVGADDVVIDLNGFTLTGVAGSFNGIVATGRLTVLNGTISSWGNAGVSGSGSTKLYDLIITNNGLDGAVVSATGVAVQSLVQGCEINNNLRSGIFGGGRTTVIDCSVSANGDDGIRGTDDWLVQDCLVSNNGDDGIDLGHGSRVIGCRMQANKNSGLEAKDRTMVSDTTAIGNSSGFLVGASSRIERCIAHDNSSGIIADKACHVIDCTATSNALNGIAGLEGTLIQRCIVSANQGGIALFEKGCRVSDCKIESNVLNGLDVSGNTTVERNSVHGNGSRGILAVSTGNRIDGNDVADNGVGIAVLAGNNLIVRNTLAFNGVHLQIAADNQQGPFVKAKGFIQNTNPWANFDLSFPTTFP